MNDLISRKALIAEYDRVHVGPPGGARKLMEDAPAVREWIPVAERLPGDRQRILCFKQAKYGSCVMTAAYSQCLESYCDIDFHGVKRGGFFDYDSEVGYYELLDITHWMPLPEPPKEGE